MVEALGGLCILFFFFLFFFLGFFFLKNNLFGYVTLYSELK